MTIENRTLIDRTVDLVLQHYAESITVGGLAKALGRQQRELERLFRRRFSLTVSDYITRVRLEHADELLCRGLPIAAVALKVGYRKSATFRARFRRYFGSSPTPSARRSDTRPVPALGAAPRDVDGNETRRRLAAMLRQRPADPRASALPGRPTHAGVVITGGTGTAKEQGARAIYRRSHRAG